MNNVSKHQLGIRGVNYATMTGGTYSATATFFDVLFPESGHFRSGMSAGAKHCIMRAMSHLRADTLNTYPSTKDGVIVPIDLKSIG